MAKISLDDFLAHRHDYKRRDGLYMDCSEYTILLAIRYYAETGSCRERLREYVREWQPTSHPHIILKQRILGTSFIKPPPFTPGQINSRLVRWVCKRLEAWLLEPYPAPHNWYYKENAHG